ncbi:unnamed protein product [Dicrocoelium dendriticum]|nr:unnamed protein product [Dicrocoelium dendriticum]
MSNAQTIQNNPGCLKGVEAQSLTVRVLLRSPNAPRESTKYMGHGVCDSSSRTHTFSEPTADVETIHRTTLSILRHLCPDPRELRGLGLQVNRLSPPSSTERSSALTHLERYTIAPNLATIPQTTVAASPILATDCSPEPSPSHDSLSPFVPCLTPIHLLVQKRHKPLRIKPHRTIRSALSINSDNVPRAFEIEPTYDEDVDSETTNKLASANTSTRDLCDSSGAPSSFDARREHATTHEHLVGQIESSACMIPPRSEDSNARSRSRQHHPISARLSVSDLKIMFRNKPTDRIRQMLANWIVTEPRPLSEDVCALASCLVSLVPYNLEGVRSCLIWLNQVMDQFCPRGSSREEWRTYIARIRATVEHSIQLCYNASLLP